MLKFKATDRQVKQAAVNAVMASRPMGMGFLQYDPRQEITIDSIHILRDEIDIDYFGGRMVKLLMWKKDDFWHCNDRIRSDYQSWAGEYPTFTDLLKSVGIQDIEQVDE